MDVVVDANVVVVLDGFVAIQKPAIKIGHFSNTFQTDSGQIPNTFNTLSRYLPDTFQTPSRHIRDTSQTPSWHRERCLLGWVCRFGVEFDKNPMTICKQK